MRSNLPLTCNPLFSATVVLWRHLVLRVSVFSGVIIMDLEIGINVAFTMCLLISGFYEKRPVRFSIYLFTDRLKNKRTGMQHVAHNSEDSNFNKWLGTQLYN